jgi:membrane associated rhomboid family serine protease
MTQPSVATRPLHPADGALYDVTILTGFLWGVELVNAFIFGGRLDAYGIAPRNFTGIPGILVWPFLHAGFAHLIANTLPFLVLGTIVRLGGRGAFIAVSMVITIGAGALVWLLARPGIVVGASGLIFGWFGYIVSDAVHSRRAIRLLAAAGVVLIYGPAILFGFIPGFGHVSWEAHLAGFAAGWIAGRSLAGRRDTTTPSPG